MAEKIVINIDGDAKELIKKLRSAQKETKKIGTIASGLKKSLPIVAKIAAVAFVGLGAAIGGAINEAKKIESVTTQFEVLTGSVEKANQTVKELQNFAATTPFQFDGIAKAAQQLLGFGFKAEDIVPKLKAIGDVASAVGQPITDIGLIFGQVSAAGKLTGERLLQFQERAIPIGPAIAKTLGVAETSVKDLVSAGKVSFKDFEKAFQSLSDEGGFAFGGMIKQSKTFAGVLSTVGDNISLLAAGIGKELLPISKKLAESFLEMLQNLRKTDNFITTTVKFWGGILSDAIVGGTEKTKKSLKEVDDELKTVNTSVDRLEKSIAKNKDNFIYNSFIGKAKQEMQEYGNLLATKTELEKRQKELSLELDRRQLEDKKALAAGDIADAVRAEGDKANALVGKKKEQFAKELELTKEHQAEISDSEFAQLGEAQARKAEMDEIAKAEELGRQGKHDAAIATLQKLRFKKFKQFKQQEKQLEIKTSQASIGLAQNTSNFLVAVQGKQTQASFILGKVAATGQVLLADSQARAAAVAASAAASIAAGPGAPAAFAANMAFYQGLITANTALALGTIAAQTITGFADGGLAAGGIPGRDSIPSMLSPNEVIVPPKTSFDDLVAAGRSFTEGGDEGGGSQSMEVTIGFTDDAFEIIEQKILENRTLGVGGI